MDLLTLGANGEFGWVTIWGPLLATQCLNRRPGNGTLHDFAFLNVMRKFLVVTVVEV